MFIKNLVLKILNFIFYQKVFIKLFYYSKATSALRKESKKQKLLYNRNCSFESMFWSNRTQDYLELFTLKYYFIHVLIKEKNYTLVSHLIFKHEAWEVEIRSKCAFAKKKKKNSLIVYCVTIQPPSSDWMIHFSRYQSLTFVSWARLIV